MHSFDSLTYTFRNGIHSDHWTVEQ